MATIRRWIPNRDVDPDYPFYCRRDEQGRIVYSVPLEAPIDLPVDESEGVEKIEYSLLRMPGGQTVRVYCWETTDREAAFAQRTWLNSECSRQRRRGPREILVGDTREDLDGSVWDSILREAYEPREAPCTEKTALDRCEINEIRQAVDEMDPRYWEIFERLRIYGEATGAIAAALGISTQRVGQLANKVRKTAERMLAPAVKKGD